MVLKEVWSLVRGSWTWKYKGNDLRKGGLKRGVLSHWWFHCILAQVNDAELICQVKKTQKDYFVQICGLNEVNCIGMLTFL